MHDALDVFYGEKGGLSGLSSCVHSLEMVLKCVILLHESEDLTLFIPNLHPSTGCLGARASNNLTPRLMTGLLDCLLLIAERGESPPLG